MRIKVTQDHIDAANFMKDQYVTELAWFYINPVALALSEAGFVDCGAWYGYGWLFNSSASVEFPTKMFWLLKFWDKGLLLEPFSFELTDDNQIVMV